MATTEALMSYFRAALFRAGLCRLVSMGVVLYTRGAINNQNRYLMAHIFESPDSEGVVGISKREYILILFSLQPAGQRHHQDPHLDESPRTDVAK